MEPICSFGLRVVSAPVSNIFPFRETLKFITVVINTWEFISELQVKRQQMYFIKSLPMMPGEKLTVLVLELDSDQWSGSSYVQSGQGKIILITV